MSATMIYTSGILFRHKNILFRYVLSFLCIFFWSVSSAQLPDGFIREQLATGLNPTSIVVAPDGRIFITEKHGEIRIVSDGELLETPLLTLEVDDSNERGLGHMVLHPAFEQNNYYYVFYPLLNIKYKLIFYYLTLFY